MLPVSNTCILFVVLFPFFSHLCPSLCSSASLSLSLSLQNQSSDRLGFLWRSPTSSQRPPSTSLLYGNWPYSRYFSISSLPQYYLPNSGFRKKKNWVFFRLEEEDEALRFGVSNPHRQHPPTPRLGVLFNLSYSEESPAPSPTSDGAATSVLGKVIVIFGWFKLSFLVPSINLFLFIVIKLGEFWCHLYKLQQKMVIRSRSRAMKTAYPL